MKFLVLCAGYGTRLQDGIKRDASGSYKHLLGLPKPLVPLGGVPLLSRWLARLSKLPGFKIENLYLVSNSFFASMFLEWAREHGLPLENVVVDHTFTNQTRLGAIRDIQLALHTMPDQDDVMVLGGDTLFYNDDLRPMVDDFNARPNCSLVTFYHDENTLLTGILETDADNMVTAFLEKPEPSSTRSRKACPCFYIFRKQVIELLDVYVKASTSLKEVDAPGTFIKWLHEREKIHAVPIEGRFDIGNLDSYIEADSHFNQ